MADESSVGICGGKSKPKINFLPQVDTTPEMSYEISERELFRCLLSDKTAKEIGETQDNETSKILKDIDLKSIITQVETHKTQNVGQIESENIFVVFHTTSEEDGGHWWSLEESAKIVTMQRSHEETAVKNKFEGKHRYQVVPIAERLQGKGSIKDFFILLWIHSVMDLKCQSFLSRCESFIPLVMKELTETYYEYPPNYFTYSALSSEEINPQLEEIVNFLTKVTKWHPLLCLTYLGDIQRFNQVLGKGFFKNKIDGIYNKLTLLNSAILFYKKEMVQHLLVKKKANARIRDKAGRNALNMAALFTDEEEIIKLLLRFKIKVDACDKSGMTALHYAVISSNLTVARHLIDHGADFKRLDPTGHSPLHLAAHYAKDSQILELLLTKVKIDECDLDGITALHSAAIASNAVSARYLLERGADINHRDKRDRTPVHVAAAFAKNVDFFKIFLTNEKADLECCDERKLTVRAYANINQHRSAKEIVSGIENKNNDKLCEYSLAGLAKWMSGLQYFGGEYEQKLIFVPDADNEPYVDHEISEAALFRFLLNKETLQQLDEAEIPDMLKVLKDVDKESKISEFETHHSNMGLRTDFKGAFHVFIVFKTTSGKDGDYWWSLEKGMDYVTLQRSLNKENVKDNLYGETRTKVKPIVENLKGKGTIQELFEILWAQQAIPEKYHIFQSFVTFVSKQITEIGYDFKGYFPYSPPPESGRDKQMLDLINVITGCSDCPPLFTLIGMGNIDLVDKIVARGKYDINAVHDGRTLLHFAIMLSKTKMVEHLLKHPLNADPTSRDPCGRTALLAAASSTMKSEIFDLLLTHPKVMIDDADEIGRTALHWAACVSNLVAVQKLLEKGANPNVFDKWGRSPLHVAAGERNGNEIMDLLLAHDKVNDKVMAGQGNVKSGETFRYRLIIENLLGRGAYGLVFQGHFKPNIKASWNEESDEEKNAAIKRVEINFKSENWMDIKNDREFVALKELRHPCIVRLFAVEDDDYFRNFVFELCQATLEDFITQKYDGLMPDEIEGLYQMVSGLKFIHEKKMIHRDIKPENILISVLDGSARLKISDFGFTKPLKEDGIHYDLASGLKGTEYYMAPELHVLRNSTPTGRVLDKDCTIATDVFAAGCTFFRYLNGGLHPFGKGFNIEVNIIRGNLVNLTSYGGESWKTNLIAEMVKFNPEERPSFSTIVEVLEIHFESTSSRSSFPSVSGEESLSPVIIVEKNENFDKTGTINVGDVQFDRSIILGTGRFGTVFAGTFKGENVAVKRVQLMDSRDSEKDFERSLEIQQLLNHRNVVQFKHLEKDDNFGYIVLELCAASLWDFIDGKYQGPMPTDEQVLFQLANGLEYIHSKKLVHREVKPANILISLTKPVQMKWSGFGLSKPVNERGTCSLSRIAGIEKWMTPEEIRMLQSEENADHRRGSVKSDIFSAGCVFIYFLLRGKHPFGKSLDIPINLLEGRPVYELPEEHFARPFVLLMIAHDPEKRISLREVIDQLKPLQPAIQLNLLQYDSKTLLCSTGTLSLVYDVGTFEGSPLAVKRVPRENCTTKSFEELQKLNHSNIVHFLHFYEDYDHRYFGMEICVASLDQIFLPEDDPKKYKGPVPSDEQFGFQLISGLEYIHGQNLVHGSIKPTNILISSSQDPQIKLSDFGLTTSRLNEGHSTKRAICGFLSSQYWLAPELLEGYSTDGQSTKESDIFAAGSVFFYFLSKGWHLFGVTTHEILENTCKGNQFNLFEKMTVGHFAMGLIRWMTQKDLKKRPQLSEVIGHLKSVQPMMTENLETVGTIQFSRHHFLDSGGQGSVFLGRYNGFEVVIKRMEILKGNQIKRMEDIVRELTALQNLSHPNIVKFFDAASNSDFIYIAIEKCLTSLDKYCRQPLHYHGVIPMPTDQQVLLQMAKGLHYIHSQKIVNESQPLIYRNVKPGNILISCDNPSVIKWADFGLSRPVVTGSKSFTWSQLKGTNRWLAPELIQSDVEAKVRGSQSCDVFALGCVFFFYLKQGIHPFGDGDKYIVQYNIKNQNQVNLNQLSKEHFAFSIIEEMIENDPHSRPKMSAVVDVLKLPAPSACLVNSWNENISQLQNLDLGN